MNAINAIPVPPHVPLKPAGQWPMLADPRHRLLLRHWAEGRGSELMAPRAAINPAALRDCLPFLWINRWDAARQDFVCTLAGEGVIQAWGVNIIGRTAAEVMGPALGLRLNLRYRAALGIPAVQFGLRTIVPPDVTQKQSTRLVLPLSDAEGAPYGVLGLTLYDYALPEHGGPEVTPEQEMELYACAGLPRALPPE
ncbi:hypothetical protein [Ferrovibrio sp.]|uniref:hypothetical protein n=1 Tax=Ferrovibrio sp. TaxID=1917215 RepID=UPI003D116DED